MMLNLKYSYTANGTVDTHFGTALAAPRPPPPRTEEYAVPTMGLVRR